jgi:microcystin-dependent protein
VATSYIGEIRMFAGNFPPQGWAFCDGQLLSIADNDALFALIGTTYGGDGQQTFALPDLRGRIPLHQGAGPGLSNRVIGEIAGAESVALSQAQIPAHSHAFFATSDAASPTSTAFGSVPATTSGTAIYGAGPGQPMSAQAVLQSGGGQSHSNIAPSLCVSFIISLFGIFPSQS